MEKKEFIINAIDADIIFWQKAAAYCDIELNNWIQRENMKNWFRTTFTGTEEESLNITQTAAFLFGVFYKQFMPGVSTLKEFATIDKGEELLFVCRLGTPYSLD